MHPSLESLLPCEFPGGRLRRLCLADLNPFQTYRGIPELGRYQGWSPLTDGEALKFLAAMNQTPMFVPGQWLQLGIAEPESDVLIGDIGLHVSEDGRTGEIGFTLQPSAQGRGIASAAVRSAVELMFAATGIIQILGVTDARNLPSVRLLKRLGFKYQSSRSVVFRGEACIEQVFAFPRNGIN